MSNTLPNASYHIYRYSIRVNSAIAFAIVSSVTAVCATACYITTVIFHSNKNIELTSSETPVLKITSAESVQP